jgi:hypothetical protein
VAVLEQLQTSSVVTGVERTVNQELLWLWHVDSSGTQEAERPSLEVGTRGLVKKQQTNNEVLVLVNYKLCKLART